LLATHFLFYIPARGLVVSASASLLVGRKFDSRPGLTKTLQITVPNLVFVFGIWYQIGTVAFLPGARRTEELQGTQAEHKETE